MKQFYSLKTVATLVFTFLFFTASAQKTWDGGGDGVNWESANNWNPNGVPGTNDDVLLNVGVNISIGNSYTIRSLRVNNNASVLFTANGGNRTITLGNTGNEIEAGSSLTLRGGSGGGGRTMTLAFSGSNRTFSIAGSLVLTNVQGGGILNLQNSITTVTGLLKNETSSNGTNGQITNSSTTRLIFETNGTYEHNINGGTIPTATWDANSNCNLTGLTGSYPSNMGQNFGNVNFQLNTGSDIVFNSNLTCQGNLSISNANAGGTLRLTDNNTNRTISVGGNLTHTSGEFRHSNSGGSGDISVQGNFIKSGSGEYIIVSGSGNSTLTVAGNIIISGGSVVLSEDNGTGTLNVAGDFTHTGGIISETAAGPGNIVFSGNSMQTYTSGGTVTGTINYRVFTGSYLQMAAAATQVTGGGTFVVESGATLGIRATDGIAITGAAGQVQVTGTRTFTTGANYIYNGTAVQTTGTGLTQNTPADLTIHNAAGVTLSAATTISGLLSMTSGTLNMANTNLTVGALTGTSNLTHSSGTAGARTLTIGSANSSTSYSGIISNGTASSVSLVKNGTGTLTLSGVHTYTGSTTINAGILQLGAANVLSNSTNVDLNGGALRTGAAGGFAETVGTLDLSANSSIVLGTGSHNLNFAASNGVTWTAGRMLTITGWLGGYNGTGGTAGRIFFGSNASGLTSGQVQQIQFFDGTNNVPAVILSTGEVVPNTPPPTNLSYTTPNIFPSGVAITALTPAVTGLVTSYSISPSLPSGLTLNTTSGIISGTPLAVSPLTTYTVTASNGSGGTTFNLQIAVSNLRYAVASGNWNATSTWAATSGGTAGASVPVAGDIVYIGEGSTDRTVTIPAGYAAACGSLNIGTTGNNTRGTLNFAAANSSLTVDGNLVMNRPNADNETSAVAIGAGSMVVNGSVTLANRSGSSTSTTRINQLTISTGSLVIAGDLTLNGQVAQQSQVVFSGAGSLTIGGDLLLPDNVGTLTPSTGTVTFNGSNQSIQDISSVSYNNLVLSGSGVKSLTNPTPLSGSLTIQSGVTLQTNNNDLSIGGNFVNSGTFAAGSSLITLTGNSNQAVAGFSTTGVFEVDKSGGTATLQSAVSAGSLTLTGGTLALGTGLVHTIAGNLNRDGGTLNGGSSTLQIGGSASGTGGSFVPGTSTVEWNGNSAQTVAAFDYFNLTLAGTGAKSFTGTTRIANSFNPGSFTTATSGTTIEFNGSVTQSIPAFNYSSLASSGTGARILDPNGVIGVAGTFTPGTNGYTTTGSTVLFNGGTQTIPVLNYHHLGYAGTGNGTFAGTTTVNGNLSVSSGTLVINGSTAARTITVEGSFLQSGSGSTDFSTAASSVTSFLLVKGSISIEGSGRFETSALTPNGTVVVGGTAPQIMTVSIPAANMAYVNLTVNNGSVLQLGSNLSFSRANGSQYRGTLLVQSGGTLDMGIYNVTGQGEGSQTAVFTLSSGATLITANANGLTGATASFTTTNLTPDFNTGANYTFNGTSAQVTTGLPAQANHLTINNASGVTLSGTAITLTGTLRLEAGAFSLAGRSITFINNNTPVQRTAGTISTNTSTTFTFGTNGNTSGADFTLPAGMFTATPSISQLTINRSNPLRAGSNDFIINGSLNLTAGVFDISGQTLTFQTGNTPIVRNAGTVTTNAATSLVFGTPGNQGGTAFTLPNSTFTASPATLLNLVVNRTNALTLGNQDLTINGTLTLTNGVLDISTRTLTFQNGNIPVERTNGTLTTNSSSGIVFGTVGNQGGNAFVLPNNLFTTAPVLNQLVLNRTNEIELSNQDITIGNTLQLTSGVLDAGSQNVILNSGASITGGSTASHVKGNLRRNLPAGNNPVLFAVGDGTVYAPVVFTPAGTVTSGGSITMQSIAGDPGNIGSSGINNSVSVNRYWRVTDVQAVPGMSSYQLQFTYAGSDNDAGTTPADYVIRVFDADEARWYPVTVSGTPGSTSATGTGIAVNRFGDFAIGNSTGTIQVDTQPVNATVCAPNGATFTAVSNSVPAPAIQWQVSVAGNPFADITSANQTSGTTYSGFTSSTLTLTGSALDLNGALFRAVFTNINGEVSSNNAQLFVNPVLTPTATLEIVNNGGSAIICAGTPLTFRAQAGNTGGGTVTYNFMLNGVSVQHTASNEYINTGLVQNDEVKCVISIAGGSCLTTTTATTDATFTSKTISVLNPAVTISSNLGTTICAGTSVTFTATAAQAGSFNLLYNFKVNGISRQSGSSNQFTVSNLQNNEVVTCDLTIQTGTCAGTTAVSNGLTMTVNPNLTPTVTLNASSSTICTGSTVTFTASAANTGGGTVNYDFKVNGVSRQSAASNTFTASNLTNGQVVTCEVVVTGGSCTAASATSNGITMNVASLPTVTLSASPTGSVCSGSPVTFTATAANTGGASVLYTFSVNGISMAPSASNTFTTSSLADNDQVQCQIELTSGTCSGATASSNLLTMDVVASFTPAVTLSVTPGTTINAGGTATFTAVASNIGGGSITYSFKVNGVTSQSGPLTVFSTNTLQNGQVVTCEISISGGTCLSSSMAVSNSITMSVTQTQYVWTGALSTNWTTDDNWSTNDAPPAGSRILIQQGSVRYPVIGSGTVSIENLTIENGGSLTVNGSGLLQIAGVLQNSGTMNAVQGSVEFNGSTLQTVNGNQFSSSTVKNLVISNNVTLSGLLQVTGVVSFGNVNNRTLNSAGFLVLKSSAGGKASVADLTNSNANSGNSITGLTTVEHYIPASRKWRGLSAPLKGSSNNSIFDNWQNGGVEEAGTGVLLWSPSGSGAAGNGFSLNNNPGASTNIRGYSVNVFNTPSNTKTTPLFTAAGPRPYIVFVTDTYKNGLTDGFIRDQSRATTLKARGELITGNYQVSGLAAGFNMIANPYASDIDFSTIGKTNFPNQFWVWDPKIAGTNGVGGYVYTANSGSGYVSAPLFGSYNNNSTVIPAGGAFFVRVNEGQEGTVSFRETDKATGAPLLFGRTQNDENRVLRVTVKDPAASVTYDGIAAVFNATSTKEIDPADAQKFAIGTENVSIRRFSRDWAIEFRPLITAADTVFLRLHNMKQQSYSLEIQGEQFATNGQLTAVLQDLFLNTETPLNLGGVQRFSFAVTAATASSGDRFRIVFRQNVITSVGPDVNSAQGIQLFPNPVARGAETHVQFRNLKAGRYQFTLFALNGVRVMNEVLVHAGGTAVQKVRVSSDLAAGVYYAEIVNEKGWKERVKVVIE